MAAITNFDVFYCVADDEAILDYVDRYLCVTGENVTVADVKSLMMDQVGRCDA